MGSSTTALFDVLIMFIPLIVVIGFVMMMLGMFRGGDSEGSTFGFFRWWYVLLIPLILFPFILFNFDLFAIILFLVVFTVIIAIILFMFEYDALPSREELDDFYSWMKKNFKW